MTEDYSVEPMGEKRNTTLIIIIVVVVVVIVLCCCCVLGTALLGGPALGNVLPDLLTPMP